MNVEKIDDDSFVIELDREELAFLAGHLGSVGTLDCKSKHHRLALDLYCAIGPLLNGTPTHHLRESEPEYIAAHQATTAWVRKNRDV